MRRTKSCRQAIERTRAGQPGLAQRNEIEQHARGILRATWDEYVYELQTRQASGKRDYE